MSSAAERPTWAVEEPVGGFGPPWPLAMELAQSFPPGSWTLIGGLMVQLHAIHGGVRIPRATVDVDMVLHIETFMSWASARRTLTSLGFVLRSPLDPEGPFHRFLRGGDVVDVLIADHPAPRALEERAPGRVLVGAPGGTSALRKTVDCTIRTADGRRVTISVPDVLGALTLKGGAYLVDSRNGRRHLEDAVILLQTIDDPDELHEDRSRWTGGDGPRIRALQAALPPNHPAWRAISDRRDRLRAQSALTILSSPPR